MATRLCQATSRCSTRCEPEARSGATPEASPHTPQKVLPDKLFSTRLHKRHVKAGRRCFVLARRLIHVNTRSGKPVCADMHIHGICPLKTISCKPGLSLWRVGEVIVQSVMGTVPNVADTGGGLPRGAVAWLCFGALLGAVPLQRMSRHLQNDELGVRFLTAPGLLIASVLDQEACLINHGRCTRPRVRATGIELGMRR